MEGKEKSGKGVVSAGEGPFVAANGPRLRCLRLAQDDLSLLRALGTKHYLFQVYSIYCFDFLSFVPALEGRFKKNESMSTGMVEIRSIDGLQVLSVPSRKAVPRTVV